MKEKSNKSGYAIIVFFISAIIFIALTLPFRFWLAASDITKMRPNTALTPVLGMIFGLPSSLGCAAGYFVSDLISGYEISYSFFGVIQQFIYGMVPYFLWKKLNKEHDGNEYRLDSVSRVLKFLLVMFLDAVLIVLCTGILNHAYKVTDFISFDNLYLFLNSFDSGLLFGCPLLIAGHFLQKYLENLRSGQKEKVFTFSLNERMILNTIIIGIGICLLIGAAVYFSDSMDAGKNTISLWGSIYLFQMTALNVYFALSLGFMWFTQKRITDPIEDLSGIAKSYYVKQSDDEKRKSMLSTCEKYSKDSTEAGNLARSYITMIKDMEVYVDNLKNVTAEKERINAELSLASNIQAHMLPCDFPAFPQHDEFDIYATMTPAKEVGGDFYDFYMTDDTHVAVVMADVSGKGVPAALFMAIAKTFLKTQAQTGNSPENVFTIVNNLLCDGNDAGLFVTAWMGILDLKDGRLTYANAGHNPPLLKHDNEFTYLRSRPGFVLAGMEDIKYRKNEIVLNPKDRLFLYTDGVTEATDSDNELYGEDRLLSYMNRHKDDKLEDVLKGLKEDIDEFVGQAPQFDDITMLILSFDRHSDRG